MQMLLGRATHSVRHIVYGTNREELGQEHHVLGSGEAGKLKFLC